jgi:hypothetical protein
MPTLQPGERDETSSIGAGMRRTREAVEARKAVNALVRLVRETIE